MLNTRSVRRRLVSYPSLAALSTDLDRVAAAYRAGTLKKLGNHEPGPILAHLAAGMRFSFDGFPTSAPWPLRLLGRLLKKRILGRPFQPGLRLRADAEKQAWKTGVTFDQGLSELRAQIARAAAPSAAPSRPHPFFGPMSPAEWQVYYLRHAELHMSFLEP